VFCNFKNLPIQERKEKTMRNGTQTLMNSVVHAAEQPTYAVVGTLLQFVSTPERNGGNLSVMRGGIPPRTIIPLHSHASPEVFYVLEGVMEVFQQDEPVLSIENTQLIHSRNARNSQISMSAKSAYKSRTNKS